MNDKYISVTQLTRYIKYKIDNDVHLNEVFLKGEISNFKAHSRGHYYFTIKDENSRINAIMFASSTKKTTFMPQDGMKVLVTGKISVFESTGAYQIYVNDMLEDGVGNLYIAYEQLKKKLEEEGLFQEKWKKPIPKIPKKVGVVTAATGAAIKDILTTIERRWPLAEVYLFPSLVQGMEAKEDLKNQIERADAFGCDTLIVGRGGGSIEDLWAFNEEMVARAIFACHTPVISAVGHEVDFTIADFVADLRAPTPTAAAEISVPKKEEIQTLLKQLNIRSQKVITNQLNQRKEKLQGILNRNILKNPIVIYQTKEMIFSNLLDRFKKNTSTYLHQKEKMLLNITSSYVFKSPYKILDQKQNRFLPILSKLEALSPLNTIQRGYAVIRKDDKVITSIKEMKKKDKIEMELKDGKINVEVL